MKRTMDEQQLKDIPLYSYENEKIFNSSLSLDDSVSRPLVLVVLRSVISALVQKAFR